MNKLTPNRGNLTHLIDNTFKFDKIKTIRDTYPYAKQLHDMITKCRHIYHVQWNYYYFITPGPLSCGSCNFKAALHKEAGQWWTTLQQEVPKQNHTSFCPLMVIQPHWKWLLAHSVTTCRSSPVTLTSWSTIFTSGTQYN